MEIILHHLKAARQESFSVLSFLLASWESQGGLVLLAAVVMLAAAAQQEQAAAPSVLRARHSAFLTWMALYVALQVFSRVKLAVLLGTVQAAGMDTVQLASELGMGNIDQEGSSSIVDYINTASVNPYVTAHNQSLWSCRFPSGLEHSTTQSI